MTTILESITSSKETAHKTILEMLDKKAYTKLEALFEEVKKPITVKPSEPDPEGEADAQDSSIKKVTKLIAKDSSKE